ncbi:hypothetical protein V2J09_013031 [Rumex salicifolius]
MAAISVSFTPTPFLSHHRRLRQTPLLSPNNHPLVCYRIPPPISTLHKPRPLSLLRCFVPRPPPPASSSDGLSGKDLSSSAEPSPLKTVFFVLLWASVSLALFAFSKDAKAAAADSIRASSFGVKVAAALRSSGWPDEAIVFSLATLPVIELRGAIPVGYWMKLSPVLLTVLSILGNMVPVPLIVLYLKKLATFLAGKSNTATRLLDILFKSVKQKAGPVEEFQWLGLMLFVAVPFPGTGAWTGAIIASILGMPFWSAVSANFFGVVLAGLLVNLLVNLGLKYAIVTGIVLFLVSTFMWSVPRGIRKSFRSSEA